MTDIPETDKLTDVIIGPIAIKSQRAADQLKWISARTIDSNENIQYQIILIAEQETYLREIGEAMEDREEKHDGPV